MQKTNTQSVNPSMKGWKTRTGEQTIHPNKQTNPTQLQQSLQLDQEMNSKLKGKPLCQLHCHWTGQQLKGTESQKWGDRLQLSADDSLQVLRRSVGGERQLAPAIIQLAQVWLRNRVVGGGETKWHTDRTTDTHSNVVDNSQYTTQLSTMLTLR